MAQTPPYGIRKKVRGEFQDETHKWMILPSLPSEPEIQKERMDEA